MGKERNEQEVLTRNRGFRYKADFLSGTSVIYEGWADPHKQTSGASWQIIKHTYTDSRLTSSDWAQNTNGTPTDDFIFIWDNRTSYTYGI